MTQDRELLLKDLCARLPYGVKYECSDIKNVWKLNAITKRQDDSVFLDIYNPLDLCKPYLFPISSMTDKQKRELRQMDAFISTFGNICFAMYDEYGHDIIPTYEDSIRITNWLLKNHFDIYGLISKGLAIDATGLNIY